MNPGHEITLDELKVWNYKLVNEVRTEQIEKGYRDSQGYLWSTSPTDISNITGVCTLIALGVVTNNQTWRDAENTNHELTPTQLVQLAGGLAIFVKTCYAVSWEHKLQIESIDIIDDLLNYDIMTGWPNL
jgi:hypothetical protein